MRFLLAVLFSLLTWEAASAQSVRQTGTVTPGHVPMWSTTGAIGDGGTAARGFLTSIGVTAQGPGICQNSAPTTGPYNRLCMGVSTAGPAQISLQNIGGAVGQNLQFVINGSTYTFPFTSGGNVVGPATTVVGHIATWANTIGTLLGDAGSASGDVISFIQAGTGAVTRTMQNKARDIVSAADFGMVCDGSTNNDTALATIKAYLDDEYAALRPLPTLQIQNGTCVFSTWPNLAYNNFRITSEGVTRLRYTGTGEAVVFDGTGGPLGIVSNMEIGPFLIEAPATATNGFRLRAVTQSRINSINVRGAGPTSACFILEFAISDTFINPICSNNTDGGGWYLAARPKYGLIATWITDANSKSSYNTFINPLFEGVLTYGAYLNNATGNVFFGGALEGIGDTGVFFEAFNPGTGVGSNENRFYGTDFEANTNADAVISGGRNELVNVVTQKLVTIAATSIDAAVSGGTHSQITIVAGAARPRAENVKFNQFNDGSTITNGSTSTILLCNSNVGVGTVLNCPNTYTRAVTDFGAVCNGSTDDTAAITAAIAATPAGGTLLFPSTTKCRVVGSGTAIFTLTFPMSFKCQGSSASGSGGGLVLASTVPDTRDLFHIIGAEDSTLRGWNFSDCNIVSESGSVGKNAIHFDSTAGTTTGFAEVVIERMYISSEVSAGGYSISLDNGASVNVNGGAFNVTIRNNWLGGGINCIKCGDSIRSEDNIITGTNAGILLDQVASAGGFISSGDNNTAAGGCIIIKTAVNFVIAANTICEIGTTTNANLAAIDIQGTVTGGWIAGQVQATVGTNVTSLIRVANAAGVFIDKTRLAEQTGVTAVRIISTAVSTCVSAMNTYIAGGTNFNDLGTASGCIWLQAQNFKNGIYVENNSVTIDAAHIIAWGTPAAAAAYLYGQASYNGVPGDAFRIANLATGVTALNFGGDDNTFPSLVRASTAVGCKLAGGGGDCPFTSSTYTASSFVSVGTKVRAVGSAPAPSACGTTPAIEGSDLSGTVTMGTGSPTGCVITFNAAYVSAPRCTVSWRTNLASMQYTISASAITLVQTGTSSNLVDYICTARSGG